VKEQIVKKSETLRTLGTNIKRGIMLLLVMGGILVLIGLSNPLGTASNPYNTTLGYQGQGYYSYQGAKLYVNSPTQFNATISKSITTTIASTTTTSATSTCQTGYVLGSDGLCHVQCGSGYCSSGAYCYNSQCVSCPSGYYLATDGYCYPNSGHSYTTIASTTILYTTTVIHTTIISYTTTITSNPGASPSTCHFNNGLPDSNCNLGSINVSVTQSNINATICVSGYTKTVRPPTSYTNPLKIQSIAAYGYSDTNITDYEEDHLIALEIGGNPTDPKNLWAEPHYGNFTSYMKDGFENYLHNQVCSGVMPLAQAQAEIATNWTKYWIQAGRP
jgi:hypothetical protein